MEIRTWLQSLGLAQYEGILRDNAVDLEVLPGLTEQHLRDLGIPLGHRIKLLSAIAELREHAAPAQPKTERRQLTIAFIDLVGSTALSAQLDPEEMSALLGSFQSTVAHHVSQHGGHVAKFMGDGVLAYFGWPTVHEDDAERAVRAGLAITAALDDMHTPFGERLAARVGIATGLVVVGDLVGTGPAQEHAVVGETPNLAARLQSIADAGEVVVSETTRRLIGDLFETRDLGLLQLKGFTNPIRGWRILSERRVESRFEALHGWKVSPLVGRREELRVLFDSWRLVQGGSGRTVLLSGEAGIGKSRLMMALREGIGGHSGATILQGSPYHTNSALFPFVDHLERVIGVDRDDDVEVKLTKLEGWLDRDDEGQAVRILAQLLAIPVTTRYPPLTLSPAEIRAKTFEIFLSRFKEIASKRSLLLVAEDVHWFDPTSLEVLEAFLGLIKELPVLLVVTFRPEFSVRWTDRPDVSLLTLKRLEDSDGISLIDQVTNSKSLPRDVLRLILAKTDGVPLFLEELTKTVLESGILADAGDHYDLTGPAADLSIPATLQDSLLARLDGLAPVKDVAQVASVIGREFEYELLAAVAGVSEEKLKAVLDDLVSAALVFRRDVSGRSAFAFKHALVRDAAYDSLLKSRRQQLHGRIASALQNQFDSRVAAEPELLARHLTEAGENERATEYWLLAGRQAAERSANVEAIAHLMKGIELLKTTPESPERARREFDLQSELGTPLIATRGFSAPETGRAYARALELYDWVREPAKLLPVLYRQWVYHVVRAEHDKGLQLAEQFTELAREQNGSGPMVVAHQISGFSHFITGSLTAARSEYEQGLELYDPVRHRSLGFDYAQDQRTTILVFYDLVLWLLGYPDRAAEARDAGIEWAEQTHHANTLGLALGVGTMLDIARRDRQAAKLHSSALNVLASNTPLPMWGAGGKLVEGWVAVMNSRDRSAIEQVRSGLAQYRAIGSTVQVPFFLAAAAEAHAVLEQYPEALAAIDQALEIVQRTRECWWEADLHRMKGEILLHDGAGAEAEAELARAVEVAISQGAKSLELRAKVSLARLWATRGNRQRSKDLLTSTYAWFTEGFETDDLMDAKAVLASVA